MNYLPLVCTLVGVAGVLYAIIVAGMVKSAPAGNERMKQISGAIAEGAIAYLNRQLKSVSIAGIIIFIIIAVTMKVTTAVGFLVGAVASYLAGYIGMRVSVIANVRVSEAPSYGKPVLVYDLKCVGSEAYLRLATEIIQREKEYRAN